MDEITQIIGNEKRLLARMLAPAHEADDEGGCIGPYSLIECLGEGGFGRVWRAEQTVPVQRQVALKIIKRGMDTGQVLARFDQERQTLASMDHPGIATMRDAGVSPTGRPYFAMELVRGGTITQWCKDHQAPLELRLRLFIQVCLAVHHAHEKGILHRDLKPSNVLMTEIDGHPAPKVIDFGIAKAMRGSLTEQSLLTQTNQVVGTPLYMSPEQIKGDGELDARSDVYALGVLLYQLLTGVTPFASDTGETGGAEAVRRAILESEPVRPGARLRRGRKLSTANGLPSFPGDLDWITLRTLEKRRERRYASAAELAADLRRYLDSQPVLARGPNLIYKAGRWTSRHRRVLMTACAGFIIGLLALALPRFFASAFWSDTCESAVHAWRFDIGFKAAPSPSAAITSQPYENTLGMRFVPVPISGGPTSGQRVLFSIWATRVKDYAAFISETKRPWTRPKFEQGPAHPVVMINWGEARAFCAWLTERERKTGRLSADLAYRLPSDHEWSCAVGIGERENPAELPINKRQAIRDLYPWGTQWPPPDHVGNYLSAETKTRWMANRPIMLSNIAIQPFPNYRDSHALTAPVGIYAPNAVGLYDLGGNVWEWCEDLYGDAARRTTRGGSWFDFKKEYMLSSMRGVIEPPIRLEHLGFRVVLAPAVAPLDPPSKPAVAPPALLPRAGPAPQAVTNSLGMRFVPVSVTGGATDGEKVLFSIWETRIQDYAVFVSETNREWSRPTFEQGATHPAVMTTWNDAQAFCAWLTEHERKTGGLQAGHAYRLPSDHEWSWAIGIGTQEEPSEIPAQKTRKLNDTYPWGTSGSPPTGFGNYQSIETKTLWQTDPPVLQSGLKLKPSPDYPDGYALTAPVGSYAPNSLGIYDLSGNVWEWCEDLFEPGTRRLVRGCSWADFRQEFLRSSMRAPLLPAIHHEHIGFRVVMASALRTTTGDSSKK